MLDEEYKHTTINGYYGTLLTMITSDHPAGAGGYGPQVYPDDGMVHAF
jgi:hypothetical protein